MMHPEIEPNIVRRRDNIKQYPRFITTLLAVNGEDGDFNAIGNFSHYLITGDSRHKICISKPLFRENSARLSNACAHQQAEKCDMEGYLHFMVA